MQRLCRALIIVLMAFPLYIYGPLLWKDGAYGGRWDFAVDVKASAAHCRGAAYILQHCEISFPDTRTNRVVSLNYVVVGADWNGAVTDIVRSSSGHISSTIAITRPALVTRASAFILLMMIAFVLERFLLFVTRKSGALKTLFPQPASVGPSHTPRVREATLLSRDRRDHVF